MADMMASSRGLNRGDRAPFSDHRWRLSTGYQHGPPCVCGRPDGPQSSSHYQDVASRLVAREYASTSWLSNQGLQWDGIATRSVSGDVALPIFFVVRTEILHQFLVGEQSQLLGNGQRRLEGARVTVGDVDRQVPTAGTMQFDS